MSHRCQQIKHGDDATQVETSNVATQDETSNDPTQMKHATDKTNDKASGQKGNDARQGNQFLKVRSEAATQAFFNIQTELDRSATFIKNLAVRRELD